MAKGKKPEKKDPFWKEIRQEPKQRGPSGSKKNKKGQGSGKKGPPRRTKSGKIRGPRTFDTPNPDAEIRLNRFIAQAGICSRREADTLISEGRIKVNGQVTTVLGTKILPRKDVVQFDGKTLQATQYVYFLLNKPKNMITTTHDPEGRRTVLDAIAGATTERVYPVGRLDRNTTGLLILTNDGELAKKLTHPSFQVRKLYHVRLDKPVHDDHIDQLKAGITLEDGPAKVDGIAYVEDKGPRDIGVEIHIGRNRIVRRMFEHFGYQVDALDRVMLAHLTKKNLPRGKWRALTPKEVAFLKMM